MHEPRPPGANTGAAAANSLKATLVELFAHSEHAVLCADAGRRICFANAAALALFGGSEDELIGRKASDLYAEAEQTASDDACQQTSADTGQGYIRWLGHRRRCDGSTFAGQTLIATLRDPRDGGLAYLEFVHEVSALAGQTQVLHALRGIMFDSALTFEARRRALLEFGCEHFGLACGAISEKDGDELVVVAAVGSEPGLQVGQAFSRGDTYCDHTLAQNAAFRRDGLTCERVPPRAYAGRLELSRYIGCPVLVGTACHGTLWFADREADGLFSQADLDLIAVLARCVGEEIEMERCIGSLRQAQDRLGHSGGRDELTGLDDRQGIAGELDNELDRLRAQPSRTLSVALLAVDHFDTLDARYGDGAGDAVLRHVAAICRDTLRAGDRVGRWSGDELLLLLPDTTSEQALVTIERLLQLVRNNRAPGATRPMDVTASAGVIEARGESNAQVIVHRADIARHLARSKGRDRVEAG